jgi:hypothetical protein
MAVHTFEEKRNIFEARVMPDYFRRKLKRKMFEVSTTHKESELIYYVIPVKG